MGNHSRWETWSDESETTSTGVTSRWRTSAFVYVQEDRAYSDLSGRSRRISPAEASILTYGRHGSFTLDDLVEHCLLKPAVVRAILRDLSEQSWIIQDSLDESETFRIDWADIETCRQCNARCGFCPQSTNPKPSGVMKSELFRLIVDAIAPYHPKSIALNHYGEPLLDPLFRERCAILKHYDLQLMLFTNGALLNNELCTFILDSCSLRAIVFNYPSVHSSEWSRFMRLPERFHERVTSAIRTIAEGCLQPVEIFVNGVTDCQERRTAEIQHAFTKHANIRVKRIVSDDRAGSQPKLVAITKTSQAERLSGCDRILRYMHFRYDGAVYLCCQDYEQTTLLGDITRQSPAEIMTSVEATQLRKQIYGMAPAAPTLICRSCSHLRRTCNGG